MTVEQVVTVAVSAIIGLGGGAAIIWVLSSWLGRVWAARILEKDRLRYQKELEAVRTELGRVSQEYLIKFSRLHAQRADIIKELHEKLVSTQTAMGSILNIFQEAGEPSLEEKIKKFVASFNDFYLFYLRRKIYFPKRICEQIEGLALELKHIHIDITTYPLDKTDPEYRVSPELLRERREFWKQARDNFENKASALAQSIEIEFRVLLGVEDK
jgi:hypothetical protein